MKRLLAVFTFCLFLVTSAHAYNYGAPFQAQAQISFSQFQATATVVNNSYQPVLCSGYAYGRTYYGQVLNSYMNNVVIYPGHFAQVHVYNYNRNAFVNAWADIWCRWY